jgi:hypothetical protein
MRRLLIGVALAGSAASIVVAQPGAPMPSREAQELGYYVGTWVGHGETKGGPLGSAGKLSSRQTCKWFQGGFQVVCEGEEIGPSGKRHFLNVLAYDDSSKAYTEYSVSSFGEAEYDRGGSLVGGTLTFVVDSHAGGKSAEFRYRESHLSPVRYTYRAELAVGAGKWSELAHGEIVKVK